MMYYPERVLFSVQIIDDCNSVLFEYIRPYKSGNAAYAAARRIAKNRYPNYKMLLIRQV